MRRAVHPSCKGNNICDSLLEVLSTGIRCGSVQEFACEDAYMYCFNTENIVSKMANGSSNSVFCNVICDTFSLFCDGLIAV